MATLRARIWGGTEPPANHHRWRLPQSPFPTFVVERTSWTILEANAAAAQVHGFAHEELVGRAFGGLVVGSWDPNVASDAQTKRMRKKDGQVFDAELALASVDDDMMVLVYPLLDETAS